MHDYARRLAGGVSQYASPPNGYISREFLVDPETSELPPALLSWSPDAVVSFLAKEDIQVLQPLATHGIPIASVSRAEPGPGRAVVIGSAQETYSLVHAHFAEVGLKVIWQFAMGETPAQNSSQQRYQHYANENGYVYLSFSAPDPADIESIHQQENIDPAVAQWVQRLPKPVGIFSQNSYGAVYLSRVCELLGIGVPREIALIGIDGFDLATSSTPHSTSIRVPGEKIGFKAAEIVASMLRGIPAPAEIIRVDGAVLIRRQSTSPDRTEGCDIDAALDFISRHACEGIKVNDVVAHTQSVSRATFHKQFRKKVGTTPAAKLLERKMSESRRLLADTEMSCEAIAGICGYQDYMHFYRVFRSSEGVSPTQYRRLLD